MQAIRIIFKRVGKQIDRFLRLQIYQQFINLTTRSY